MCDAIFSFGQSGNHFFQCPSRREYSRLPRKLQGLLTSNQTWQIHHVTLGYEDSFLITWRDRSGGDHIDSQDLPPELDSFIYATNSQNIPIRNIPQIRATLGPYNDSFFAHDNSAYQWMNLPSPLLTALDTRITGSSWHDKPRIVALGCENNFLIITAANAAVWDLSHYRTMNEMLRFSSTQPRGIQEVQNIVLHPYRYQCFIAQSSNGSLLFENLPPHELPSVQSMMAPIINDTRVEEEKRQRRIENLERRNSGAGYTGQRERHEMLRAEWTDRKQQFKMEAKGLRLSLRMGISAGGIKRMLGNG